MREPKRGCGYRKVGGLYMVAGKFNASCHGLPFLLEVCPVCSQGIKQARGWTWISPCELFTQDTTNCKLRHCERCPVSNPPAGRHGLLWIGVAHYPSPSDFMSEARRLGISRRVQFVPNDFRLGETWLYLAHPHAFPPLDKESIGHDGEGTPGIITVFKPERIELIVTPDQAKDGEFMEKCDKRGVTPVVLDESDEEEETEHQEELAL